MNAGGSRPLPSTGVIGTVGDLVEDVVVRLGGPINVASDTAAVVRRRRGGSAANMAVGVVRAGGRARFVGQVGADPQGQHLVDALAAEGVDVVVRRSGRSGTIIVLVDAAGERTMLTDRGAAADLSDPDPAWLDGLDTLHVPVYSLIGGALASTATTLVEWAHERGIRVSIDASSAAVLAEHGRCASRMLLTSLRPDVLLCNELEASTLGGVVPVTAIGAALTIVKQGADDCLVIERSGDTTTTTTSVPAIRLDGVRDTTGAGDAFAAGLLLALADGAGPLDAARRGHEVAAAAIARVSSDDEPDPWMAELGPS